MTAIPFFTLAAYLGTDYCIFAGPPFILRIGAASAPLSKLYRQHECNCAAFVTACNPYSQQVGASVNAARQTRLRDELQQCGLIFFDGEGKHPDGNWPAEPSFLVLGLALEEAKDLGRRYEQNAIVWCGADAVAELVVLR